MADWLRKTRSSRVGSQRTVANVSGSYSRCGGHTRTVIGHRVNPLVQRRVNLSDDVLFPLLSDESKRSFTLINRILAGAHFVSSSPHKDEFALTIVRRANARIWFSRR